ncbi:MAG: TIGR03619 family F420-dependent LLM class oxidoreductase [Acidimicrobiia bacterium]|nr:TIGR03619 family F420-dependent LLM class oxidoreductase [Acidimicrobiia bacterium]MDH4364136.1 TIGR03619 family F420-dependent LLM class oxidoreductase [Acidimicrobiia bacterium]MDH5288722.1 TIGR03619 family F420-dependent LLM class oxidoreductase [Acidimicrobiia bacterium]
MKIGLASPNSSYGVPTAEVAVDLEQRGYDSLWVGEHSHIPTSRETPHPSGQELPRFYWHMRDPFVSLAMAAQATTTLKLVTGVCLVLEHEIVDLAKQVATIDDLSGGRFLFGVGVGWNREELENVSDVPWSQRYNAMRETVAALRELWAADSAGYSGRFVNVAESWVYPKPTRPEGPPVLMGCQGRLGMKHVAEYADEWCPLDIGFRDVARGLGWMRDVAETAGRDPGSIPVTMYCFGSPDAAKLEQYRELGIVRTVLSAPDEPDAHHRFLDRVQPLVDEYR